MSKPLNEYALYKGEKLVSMGTAKEIANELNVSVPTIYSYGTPRNERRNKGNRLTLVKLD